MLRGSQGILASRNRGCFSWTIRMAPGSPARWAASNSSARFWYWSSVERNGSGLKSIACIFSRCARCYHGTVMAMPLREKPIPQVHIRARADINSTCHRDLTPMNMSRLAAVVLLQVLPFFLVYSRLNGSHAMNAADFRRIALSLDGAEEGSHLGAADFRVGKRIFATLASQKQGYGNLMLTPEQQVEFVAELPEVFVPVAGGWGRMGATHVRLAEANEDLLAGALRVAWKLRVEKNPSTGKKTRAKAKRRR